MRSCQSSATTRMFLSCEQHRHGSCEMQISGCISLIRQSLPAIHFVLGITVPQTAKVSGKINR
ncbi:hypothetical protein LZ31DRAFT_152290 [Colletotrichum somersetense]|nr:hypothetical protein LZ31DRAFT_152290 [Colletotrichum somersetense]